MQTRRAATTAVLLIAIAVMLASACGDSDEPSAEPAPGLDVAAVVSAHELATASGIQILESGGNAADAAVAVAATLSVVEPWFSSALGGGTWGLYFDAHSNTITSLDGVGPTGSKATSEAYEPLAGKGGIHQSNVPGAWDGWMLWLDGYGTLGLDEVLAPAIAIAREGYVIGPGMAGWLDRSLIVARPDTDAIYAPNGQLLTEGDTVYQHDLADTFEALANAYLEAEPEGRSAGIQAARDYYYRGPLAEAIVAFSDAHGGFLTIEDFNGFEAQIVEPISIDWDDTTTVYENPPNSQGITMLMALNILKDHEFVDRDADALHLQVEALKLAFADRNEFVGDPARVDVPVERLLSDDHAASQRARIDMEAAAEWPIDAMPVVNLAPPSDRDEVPWGTSTFHIVDSQGNGAAVTTSLGAQFLVVGDTGIHMNNRMRFLSVEEGNANELTPGFKVRHTSNPYMVFRDGRLSILGGNTGVDTQPQGQLQQFLNVVEFGFTAQEAIDEPRFVSTGFPSSTYPYSVGGTLDVEDGFSDALVSALEERGHEVETGGTFGTAAMIVVAPDGTSVEVGVDARNDTSVGEVIPAD